MNVKYRARTPIKPMRIIFKKTEWWAYHSTQQQKALLRQFIISPYNEKRDDDIGGRELFEPSSRKENIVTRLTINK